MNKFNSKGLTPLMVAVEKGQKRLVEKLIEQGADLDIRSAIIGDGWNETQETALVKVLRAKHSICVHLKKTNPCLEETGEEFEKVIQNAAAEIVKDIACLLIDSGADIEVTDTGGMTPVMWAVKMANTPVLKKLVEKGADVNKTDEEGFTALMYTVQTDQIDAAVLLLEHGADVNQKIEAGSTHSRLCCGEEENGTL